MATWSDFEQVKAYILARLERDLAPTLYYHNLAHTRDDVLPAAIRLLAGEGANQKERLLLQTAVLFHDSGQLEQYEGHEAVSLQIAAATLPGFGYDHAEIAPILDLIAATRLSQQPANLLEELIKDADLDVLGRDDFFAKNACLLEELRAQGAMIPDRAWRCSQLVFLKEHVYYTSTARHLRDSQKQRNIEIMQALLKDDAQQEC